MSLQQRLIAVVISLIVSLLAANLILSVSNAREKLFEQLQSHAVDTATSLGLTISHAAQNKDESQVLTMISVIFDSGYYRRIVYRDLNTQKTVSRNHEDLSVPNVPDWFVQWFDLPEPEGRATVSSGWYQVGNIQVVGHPGLAYQGLWLVFKSQLWLFLAAGLICIGLTSLVLHYLLDPLRKVQAQAEGICRREFHVQEPLPKVPEMRQVATAMNRMVLKIKAMFQEQVQLNDKLHQQLHTDSLTTLNNRDYFDRRLKASLSADKAGGSLVLALVSLTNLEEINRHYSREMGDNYIQQVAQVLKNSLKNYPAGELARHRGADFAVVIPALGIDEVKAWLSELAAATDQLKSDDQVRGKVYVGAAFSSVADADQALMALADAALSQAMEQKKQYQLQLFNADQPVFAANQWRDLLAQSINDRELQLYYQPVWRHTRDNTLLFYEVTSAITLEGKSQSAAVFMPIVTRFGLARAMDEAVLDLVTLANTQESLCINLSLASIEQPDFLGALKEIFSTHPGLARRLVFELSASSLTLAEESVRTFAEMVKAAGSGFSLHHFGQGAADFAYLQSLPVDYLKIDRFFIQDIDKNEDHRFFVRSLIAIAKSCDITVLAEGVESDAQWQQLLQLGIDGGQGFFLGRPQMDIL